MDQVVLLQGCSGKCVDIARVNDLSILKSLQEKFETSFDIVILIEELGNQVGRLKEKVAKDSVALRNGVAISDD